MKYAVDFISDVKIDNWPRRRGPYLQFLTHFVSFEIPEWMLLEQVHELEWLSIFLNNGNWGGNLYEQRFFGICCQILNEKCCFSQRSIFF